MCNSLAAQLSRAILKPFEGNNDIIKSKTAISYVLHQLTNGKA
jgi:hypothetical protein